ncbi:hypothetical protein ASE21_02230 [Flavobacterium sp. Root901]|uniref:hypothetical protein n=1 Tax=Flavobacterium sp. Root901 TaxID=1736605 RepID=UPI000709EF3F|nr:hypothetical protein [Flavobacterium sp. Root901]KRD12746.1 hypothetical protein ASE21_02230 [Flavobacterium sp. Root901]
MRKNTLDEIENEYKEAIRNKYKIEKIEGKHAHYLNNPSQALLRDLCWEIFNSTPKAHDLVVYRNFFKSDFIPNEEDTSIQYTDKFRKVGAFLKGGKEPAKITTVELAAILVDFEFRPFQKFIKEGINGRDNDNREGKIISGEVIEETKKEDSTEKKQKNESSETFKNKPKPSKINELVNFIKSVLEKIYISKRTVIATLFIFSLIATVIYFAFFKNHCMQWSEDHYEVVDCSSRDNGNPNVILPLDESLLDFKKLKACDTTPCFMKNGEAFVWYGKIGDSVDFFNDNGNGRHPETNAALRPVTHYMFNKYLKGKPCK